ncbi:MAG: hypothetical protein AABX45_02255 [Nanoarchaeota archaeon]
MTQENQNQDYLQGLEKILAMHGVESTSKDYLRYKAGLIKKNPDGSEVTDSQYIMPLGRIINPDDPEMFLNETQAAIEHEVDNYKETREDEVNKAFKKYKGQIISDYASVVNKVLDEATKNVKSKLEEQLKKVPADKRKEIIKQNLEVSLYQLLGQLVKDLDLTENYKGNKDLVEAVNNLKDLDNLEDSERPNAVADKIIEQNRLTDNYRNFRRDWNSMYGQLRANYTRIIGKQLLKESNGKYSINEELLKEAYSNVEAAKKMSPRVQSKYKKAS